MALPRITEKHEKAVLAVQAAIDKLPKDLKVLIDNEDEEKPCLVAYFDIGGGNWMAVHEFIL